MGNSHTLFASLIWGSVGLGFAIYGKKQAAAVPLIGGLAMIAISYFIRSALCMSLAGLGVLAAIVYFRRWSD